MGVARTMEELEPLVELAALAPHVKDGYPARTRTSTKWTKTTCATITPRGSALSNGNLTAAPPISSGRAEKKRVFEGLQQNQLPTW